MKPEEFFTKQQLGRYNYAVALANKLKQYQQEGYYLVDEYGITKDWSIDIEDNFSDNCWDVVSVHVDNCYHSIVDLSWWDNGKPFIDSKTQIKAAFNKLMVVHPKHFKKF